MYIVFAGLLAVAVPTSGSNKQFRSDYVYNPDSDAFYKLHIETSNKIRAETVCQSEGAQLMLPNANDIVQLHGMIKNFPDIGDHVWVASDGLAHESAEEQEIINLQNPSENYTPIKGECEVVSRQGETLSSMCYRQLPFICKAKASTVPYDPICKVHSKGYKYYQNIGSCYKMSRVSYSWNEAYGECRAENSHLVILNSETERQLIFNITNAAPPVEGATTSWFFFAGIRAPKTTDDNLRVFKTVFNQTLADAGFDEWSVGEPNNYLNNEYCGTIFKNDGKYNDADCSHSYAFICEKEIN